MGQTLPVAPESASEVVATYREEQTVISIIATSRKPSKWFTGLAKRISKEKPAAAIHHLTGEAERTCYDWCGGAVDPPARVVIKILHTNIGWLALEYLMRGCKEAWWAEVREARECAGAYEARKRQIQGELNLR